MKEKRISESEIIKPALTIINDNPGINMSELIKELQKIIELYPGDREILKGRTDNKFSQIVRNVVAHAPNGVTSRSGYILDKTKKPAVFYAKTINSDDVAAAKISDEQIKERKEKSRKFAARKIDFNTINKFHSVLGDFGEIFALKWERNRLIDLGVTFNVLDEVVHFSKAFGDGAGYDILSRKDNGYELLHIEVKTTKGGLDTPFYMSENERAFIEEYKENTLIYRVYNYNQETDVGEIEIITYEDLVTKYNFNPVNYKVIQKQ